MGLSRGQAPLISHSSHARRARLRSVFAKKYGITPARSSPIPFFSKGATQGLLAGKTTQTQSRQDCALKGIGILWEGCATTNAELG